MANLRVCVSGEPLTHTEAQPPATHARNTQRQHHTGTTGNKHQTPNGARGSLYPGYGPAYPRRAGGGAVLRPPEVFLK